MAKLIEVNEPDKQKAFIKKTIIWVISLGFMLGAVWLNYGFHDNEGETADEPKLYVHVKGAVNQSGVYQVAFGTRVCDLADYVGGFLDNADIDGVNLAAFVVDGQEVYIPYKGSAQTGALNLNTATSDELQTVTGIGETYARKIIKYREAHGGFTSVTELREVLGVSLYEAVREEFYVS